MKKLLAGLAILIVIAVIGFVIWAENPLGPMPEANAALISSAEVIVSETEEGWFVFTPTEARSDTTLIYYPGGHVDPKAYAPFVRAIAEGGYRAILVPMPLNLAVFDSDEALEVIEAFPTVTRWVIGGHSLGGAMAALMVDKHPDLFDALVLYGSYPAESNDLSDILLPVLSVYGSEDGGADKIGDSLRLLPEGAKLVMMDGGNHAQFGYYGPQGGDGEATIPREIQQEVSVEMTLDFMSALP